VTRESLAYRGCRERIIEVATDLDRDQLSLAVPACPDWTVTQLLAHLVGVAEDFAADNLEDAGSQEWTEAQVARRSRLTPAEIVEKWESLSRDLEPSLDRIRPGIAAMLISDAVTHEHDLRGAVDRPGARDSDALLIALERSVKRFGKRIKDARLPSVIVRCEDETWQAGVLAPAVELQGDRFELVRALQGRRTTREIASLRWAGDARPYVELAPSHPPPRVSLSE
jgi:uncharacterized protein (TIGR03083 family)